MLLIVGAEDCPGGRLGIRGAGLGFTRFFATDSAGPAGLRLGFGAD